MKKLILIPLIILGIVSFWGCKDGKDKDNKQDSTVVEDNNDIKTFYLVPSPEDVFGFAEDKNLKFQKELLNPVENLSKYNDVKLQEFNFGVYSADLAYCAASNKNDETVQYLNTVRKLSQAIGLADVFNESLVYRIEHVSPVKDSLIALSNDTYFDIMRFLERNDRNTTLSIMATGGWLECMYLVLNQITYKKDSPTIQKIADQKVIITNLWMFLEQNQTDPNIKSIMSEFEKIYKLYESLEVIVLEDNTNVTDQNEKIIVVGGNHKVVINEQQFNDLKKYVSEVRNKLTLNNVSL